MREILFKAYDKLNNKFYKVQSIDFNCLGEIETITVFENDSLLKSYNRGHNSDLWNIDSLVLCEYTGLNDKNGVKIFENDIVKMQQVNLESEWEDSWGTSHYDYDEVNVTMTMDFAYTYEFTGEFLDDMEVIGNVWDEEVK